MTARRCDSKRHDADPQPVAATRIVYWPGQTVHLCDRCAAWAAVLARSLGFELHSDQLPGAPPPRARAIGRL